MLTREYTFDKYGPESSLFTFNHGPSLRPQTQLMYQSTLTNLMKIHQTLIYYWQIIYFIGMKNPDC